MFHRLNLEIEIKKSYLGCTAEQFGQVLPCSLIDCVLLFCFTSNSDQPAQTASLTRVIIVRKTIFLISEE